MAFSGLGAGTEGDPYQVATAGQLNEVRDYLGSYFIQTADIDLSGYANWVPIGNGGPSNQFEGVYDGDGYNISNLTINSYAYNGSGLFGFISAATLENIRLVNVDINLSSNDDVASLCGVCSASTIRRCSVNGIIVGKQFVGGLISFIQGGSCLIEECFSDCTIYSQWYGSGFVSYVSDATNTIKNCYALGSVTGTAGGTSGFVYLADQAVIENCYSAVEITSGDAKGFCYTNYSSTSTITNCYWDTETSGVATSSGGTGRTTAEMVYPTNLEYTDWDFTTIWRYDKTVAGVNDNYPMLRWQEYPTPTYDVDREFTVKLSMTFYKYEKNNYFDAVNINCKVVSEDNLTEID